METNKSQNQRTVTTEYLDLCLQLPIAAVIKANWRVVDVTARDSYLGGENRLPFANGRDKVNPAAKNIFCTDSADSKG